MLEAIFSQNGIHKYIPDTWVNLFNAKLLEHEAFPQLIIAHTISNPKEREVRRVSALERRRKHRNLIWCAMANSFVN